MAVYPNYSMPMNNGYGCQQMPMQNPYQQRMDFLQGYQQSLQVTDSFCCFLGFYASSDENTVLAQVFEEHCDIPRSS